MVLAIRKWLPAPVVILAALLISACGSMGGTQDATTPAANADLEAIYRARLESARNRFTQADVDFMTGMIAHHAQAIVMSRLAPDRAASTEVQTLAARIINAQHDEITSMQQWLRDRGQPVPELHDTGRTVMVHGGHAMHMPGMLTPEELQSLEKARGPEFDRLFLTFMIKHHRGAVTMVDELFRTDGAAQDDAAFKLASDINVDQITEIERMERMLSRYN